MREDALWQLEDEILFSVCHLRLLEDTLRQLEIKIVFLLGTMQAQMELLHEALLLSGPFVLGSPTANTLYRKPA